MSTPPAFPEPPKKGVFPLVVFGIGCAALALLVFGCVVVLGMKACHAVKEVVSDFQKNPAKASAMLMVKMNPDLEVVKTDDAKGEITIKIKKTGEVLTMSFDELSKGKFKVKDAQGKETVFDGSDAEHKGISIKGPDGQTVIGGTQGSMTFPDWVPRYPGMTVEPSGVTVVKEGKASGLITATTPDDLEKVRDNYDSQLKAAGYTTQVSTVNLSGSPLAEVKGTKEDKQTVSVAISRDKDKTRIILQYEQK